MFCNQCGTQCEEVQQYCCTCGVYLKKEGIQSSETTFNFCRSCGHEISGRYCVKCGDSSIQTNGKLKTTTIGMEQLKQTSVAVGDAMKRVIPGKDKLTNFKLDKMKLEQPPKEQLVKWIKQGVLLGIMVAVMSLLISFVGSLLIRQSSLFEELAYGYGDWDTTLKSAFNTLFNTGVLIFTSLFGGQASWEIALGRQVQLDVVIMTPFVGILVTALIIALGEKLRASIGKEKLTLLGSGILAVSTGFIVSISSLLLSKSLRIKEAQLDEIGLSYWMGFQEIKSVVLSSKVNGIATFFIVTLITLVVLLLMLKDKESKSYAIVSAIKKVVLTVVGFSFVMALGIVLRVVIEMWDTIEMAINMSDGGILQWILNISILLIVLTGCLLSMFVTGQYNVIEILNYSESGMKLKMTLFNFICEYSNGEEKVGNFMMVWFLLAMLIVVVIILTAAYQFWSKRTVTIKNACCEAGIISIGIGGLIAIISKTANSSLHVLFKMKLQGLGSDGFDKLSLTMNTGNDFMAIWVAVACLTFILFMGMYWFVNHNLSITEKITTYMNFKIIWVIIALVSIAFTIQFDVYDINESNTIFLEDAIESLEEGIEDITDRLNW